MPVVRWTAVIAIATLVSACAFDPGGTILAGDETVDASSSTFDGANVGPIDAAPQLPLDAGPTMPIDASTTTPATCDELSDCPGQLCCLYAGGLASACSPTCVGGEQACEVEADCSGNDRCCEHVFGPSTCGFCF